MSDEADDIVKIDKHWKRVAERLMNSSSKILGDINTVLPEQSYATMTGALAAFKVMSEDLEKLLRALVPKDGPSVEEVISNACAEIRAIAGTWVT